MKVLIAVDGSDRALRAIDAVARWPGAPASVEILLLNVRERPAHFGDFPPFDDESVEARIESVQDQVLEVAERHARRAGLERVTLERASGHPATEIARVAHARDVDHIAMSTHGRTAIAGLFLGSVAQRVLHHVDVPVLLVK
ncbi:universal stress protein [Rhizobacter sp. Root1221]|uniref:universal stress protein n=1 Tax=Rhizobacter sp. Root1221 TaxID=1736433 RepID=UPI0006F3B12A|nr:universal stress protein [Rhizobacter sp. Root1221]KQV81244.1 hypothetical protein ASC87_09970 [Rhizobacter sp. Root1221]